MEEIMTNKRQKNPLKINKQKTIKADSVAGSLRSIPRTVMGLYRIIGLHYNH
jgi:hypothetical protein